MKSEWILTTTGGYLHTYCHTKGQDEHMTTGTVPVVALAAFSGATTNLTVSKER